MPQILSVSAICWSYMMMGMVQVAASRAMVRGGLVTVHARHHHVHEDQVRLRSCSGDGILTALRGDHLKTVPRQNFLHGIAFGGRIIHHEDLVDRHLFYLICCWFRQLPRCGRARRPP